ncbi:MAG TPA: MMPL family transporter [Steroidobacteraceae bacterium]|jgi:predicted exporter
MKARRARILALWLVSVAAAVGVVAHARYITDLSAFLPAKPTPLQQLLVDQLRDGPASRLILIALEDGDPKDRAQISTAMVHRLRNDAEFSSVDNGEPLAAERDRDFLFQHRYLLSNAVTAQRFSAAGLKAAIEETIQDLASSTGLMLKTLVPHDPTGETLRIIDQLTRTQGPKTQDGVWVSADGARALMIAQTAAPGSDTDAQERALETIRGAFRSSLGSAGSGAAATHLRLSGPGVFAVAARAKIKRAALRLSIVSSILVIGVLLAVYRSIAALVLGLLPVATGALLGIAAVALVFGVVHGITLGFGITLIGESVDYSIYFFIQSLRREAGSASESWQRLLWPTIRLGMLTSVCGFASLLPSGFPGLAQLGLYSISGLIAAALVTRFVLPELLPHGFKIRDVAPLGLRIGRLRDSMRGRGGFAIGGTACAIAVIAFAVLYRHHDTLWNRELSRLSPMSVEDLRYDAKLRADLGAADVLDIVIVGGPTLEAVLRGAERAGSTLQTLIDAGIIGEFDTPANYLPSLATQQARRSALPDPQVLHDHLQLALAGLDLRADQLAPFIADVEAARHAALLTAEDLQGTSLAAGLGALILHRKSDRWSALLPLHAADGAATPHIDVARVSAALAAANLNDTQVLDLKTQTDALYAGYLQEAIRLSLCGLAVIVLLLLFALRSALRVARVLAPLVLAVLAVAAGLALFGQQLTILHLVGMLLIVAVGSNYALFFDHEGTRRRDGTSPLTLASLGIANISTVIGFGLLSFSQVPVLEALGTTVAPGAFLALLFSALMTSRAPPAAHQPISRPARPAPAAQTDATGSP